MKKSKAQSKPDEISPEEALAFIDSYQKMLAEIDEPTQLISLRVPANILRVLKTTAKIEGKKYQSMIVEMIRAGIRERNRKV